MALQQLRSSTANKRPTAAAMSDGQLAVNTNATNPGLFFKDADGSVRKVGPVFIGSSAPNSSPATGGSTGHAVGEQWLDNTGGTYVLKIWDGTAWRSESGTFVDVSGDTMTGDLVMNNANLVFEGATADDFETTLTVTDPTADRTIALPNVSGTVVTTGDTGTVTSTMIVDGTIVNADVNTSAAIVGTKISPDFGSQNVTTTGKIEVGTVIDLNANGSAYFASNVGIGVTSPSTKLHVSGGSGTAFTLDGSNDYSSTASIFMNQGRSEIRTTINASGGNPGGSLLFRTRNNAGSLVDAITIDSNQTVTINSAAGTNPLIVSDGGAEAMRIDSAGRLLVGTSSSSGVGATLQVIGDTAGQFHRGVNDASGAGIAISKSRSTTYGSYNIVQDDDLIGTVTFRADDGTDYNSTAALIGCHVDGTPGSNDMPGRLVLATTADGASSPTERMRIDSAGRVGIGTSSPSESLEVAGNGFKVSGQTSSVTDEGLTFDWDSGSNNGRIFSESAGSSNLLFYTTASGSRGERMRIDSSGRLLVGTSSASSNLGLLVVQGYGGSTAGEGTIDLIRGNNVTASTQGLGSINFGHSQYQGASIDALSEGAWTEGSSHPSRLAFSTTASGASSPTERMRLDSNGRLGLGISSPQKLAHISNTYNAPTGGHNAETFLIVSNGLTNGNACGIEIQGGRSGSSFIEFGDTDNADVGRIVYSHAANSLATIVNGSVATFIDSSGRLGLGTTSPTDHGGYGGTLEISGSPGGALYLKSSSDVGQLGMNSSGLQLRTRTAKDILFTTNNTERARIDSSGNVGINNSSPGSYASDGRNLVVGSGSGSNGITIASGASNSGTIYFADGTSGASLYTGTITYNHSSNHMAFWANETERMRITSNGYVQINANSSNLARLNFVNDFTRIENNAGTGHIELYTNNAVRNRFLYNGQGTAFSNQSIVYPTTDNAVDLGGASNRWDDVYATNGTIQTSDSRLKHEVETSVLGTDFVKALRPVSYKWIGGENVPIVDGTEENGDNIYRTDGDGNWVYESRAGARKHWGFIAQEVKQAVDDAGVDFAGWTLADKDDPDSTQSLRYEEFIAPLTKALQEAITKIETLEAKVAALEAG
nr:putative endosialidase [uncultured Mediterranean phage MEDS2 group]